MKMTYYTIPAKRFANLIKSFWVLENDQPYTHYSMADVCPELLFHFKGQVNELFDNGKTEKSFTAGIHGQTHSTRKFHIDKAFGIFWGLPLSTGNALTVRVTRNRIYQSDA